MAVLIYGVPGLIDVLAEECRDKLDVDVSKIETSKVFAVVKEGITPETVTKLKGIRVAGYAFWLMHSCNDFFVSNESKDVAITKVSRVAVEMEMQSAIAAWFKFTGYPKIRSFRVSCKRAGQDLFRHNFTSTDIEQCVGGILHTRYQWKPDMKNFDMEIVVRITGPSIHFCTKLGNLKHRNCAELGRTSLQGNIAYGLAHLCDIKEGDVFVDLLCGVGTIGLEVSLAFKAFAINGDNDPKQILHCLKNYQQLQEGSKNFQHVQRQKLNKDKQKQIDELQSSLSDAKKELAGLQQFLRDCQETFRQDIAAAIALLGGDATHFPPVEQLCDYPEPPTRSMQKLVTSFPPGEVLHWDATSLPLRTGSVDKIATDIPFGKQVGTYEEVWKLYPKVFREMARVLCVGGRAVILSGRRRRMWFFFTATKWGQDVWDQTTIQQRIISMGGSRITVFVLNRSLISFNDCAPLLEDDVQRAKELP